VIGTKKIATILLLSIVFSHTPGWGQGAAVIHELNAQAPAPAPVELGTQPVSMDVPMREDASAQIAAAVAPGSKTALILAVAGLTIGTPDVHYEVYLNLPKNEEPNFKSAHFVGNLAPFQPKGDAKELPFTVKFDITKNVRELKSLTAWNDKQLSVTFVMRGLVDREGRPIPVPAGVRGRVNSVKVTTSQQ
jgi:hypothetical protein